MKIFGEKMFLLLALFGVHFADEIHSSFYEWESKKVVEKINDLKKYQMFDDDGKQSLPAELSGLFSVFLNSLF